MPTRSLPHFQFHRVALSILGLAAAAASVMMAVLLVVLPEDLTAFIVSNVLDARARKLLLLLPAASAGIVVLGTTIAVGFGRTRARLAVESFAQVCCPLLLFWAVPVLTCYRAWVGHPLQFLLLLSLFGLALERTLRCSLNAIPPELLFRWQLAVGALDGPRGRYVALAFVLLACTGYAAYFHHYTILEHHRLTTGTLDLGIGDNLMANGLAGKYFRTPSLLPDGSLLLRGHAVFGMFLYLPFYAIRPCSETLLTIQAVTIGFAALPLYLFAATQVRRLYACIIACCYLLSPIVHGPNFYDFHFLPTAMFFHFWLYYALATRKSWLVGLSWFILVAMREDISLGLTVLGVVLALSGARVKYGITIAIASGIMFGIIKFVIMPAAGTWFFSDHFAGLYIPGEKSYASVITTILTNPTLLLTSLIAQHKLVFALHVFAPLLFLSWRNPWLLVVTLAAFPSTLMVTDGPSITNIGFQYVSHWVPYVFGGAVIALRLIGHHSGDPKRVFSAAFGVLAAVLMHSLVFGAVLQTNTYTAAAKPIPMKMSEEERADYAALVELRARIPKGAIVAGDPQMYPHISHWPDAYDLERAHGNAQYLLLSPRAAFKARGVLTHLLADVPYGLVQKKGTIYLFEREQPETDETRAAWAELKIPVPARRAD